MKVDGRYIFEGGLKQNTWYNNILEKTVEKEYSECSFRNLTFQLNIVIK